MPKPKNLQQNLWDIQQRFGANALNTLRALSPDRETISTGFPALDALLGESGIVHGQITEIAGTPTSGVTTIAHKALAGAQGRDKTAAYLDLSGTFDPDYAAHYSVDLARLLIIRPPDFASAIEIARDLIRVESTGMVVIDAIGQPTGKGGALKPLHDAILRSRCAALLLVPMPLTGDADRFFHTRLQVERCAWLYEGDDICGYETRVTVVKDKRQPGERQTTILISVDREIDGGAL